MIRLAHEGDERLVAFWGSLLPLAQDPSYLDVTLVCKDGQTRGNRLFLALAIPHMENLLREREGEQTMMLLPDFKIQEVVRCVEDFFQAQLGENVKDEADIEDKSLFENDHHMDYYESDDGLDDLNDQDFEPKVESTEQSKKVKRNRTVRNPRQMKRVEKNVSNFDLPEICPICRPERKLAIIPFRRRRHFEIHHQVSSLYLHPCHYCWEWFPTQEDLESHLMYHREDPELLYCNICSATIKAQMNTKFLFYKEEKDGTVILVGQNTLNSHLKSHEEKPICKTCGKELEHARALSLHMQSHKEKTFTCDVCGAKFVHRQALEDHTNIKHSGKLDFACEECEKRFPTSSYLKSHQKSHTDLKPYICKGCGRGFRTKKEADRHFISKHTDIRPLKCSYEGCTKTFTLTSTKNIHERTHTGDKPYKCTFCEKAYTRGSSLNKHMKIHTGKHLNGNIDIDFNCDL